MSRPTVVGLDLSLTSTGVAFVDNRVIETSTIKSTGKKDASLPERSGRLADLVARIVVECTTAHLVVVEGPSFGQHRQSGQHDRAGLWWLVVEALHTAGHDVVDVTPAARAKYATGKGNAPKDHVLAAVVRRFPDIDVTGNDEADALILAAMGCRHLGHPIDDVPLLNQGGMSKVRWPAPAGPGF